MRKVHSKEWNNEKVGVTILQTEAKRCLFIFSLPACLPACLPAPANDDIPRNETFVWRCVALLLRENQACIMQAGGRRAMMMISKRVTGMF
jgi:hypothetical protein